MKQLFTYFLVLISFISIPAQRLNAQVGANDPTFNTLDDGTYGDDSGASGTVSTIALQPDGKVIIGGNFTSYNGTARNRIARLNADGSLDATFDPGSGANTSVGTMALQPDGKVIIGGSFTSYNGTSRTRMARLNADGSLDATLNPGTGTSSSVWTMALQPDGKVIIGGGFMTYNGTARPRIARVNADGSLDATFNPGSGSNNYLYTIALQPDGKVIIGGGLTMYNGTSITRTARVNADGSLDATFNPGTGASSTVFTTALQPDGKVIIGGQFNTYNGTARNSIARLNADGSLDATFNPGTGAFGAVNTMALQPDGKVIIGGNFISYNGTARNYIARLNADGSLDATFNPGTGANNMVFITALQPDGKVIIGGLFTTYNGTARNRIARLNADGSLDATFNPGTGANSDVQTTALQPDGKVIIGGSFTSYNGTARARMARLNADGSLDATFNPGTGANNTVFTTALQPDGKVIIGGSFTTYNGTARNRVARILGDAPPPEWTGTTSTDWNNATNWSMGTVPTGTDDVTIPTTPTGGNMPTVNISGAQVNAITIESGATLTISSGNALTVSGTLTNNGTVTVQNSGSLVQATGSTLAGSGIYNVVRNGASGQRFNFWSSPITAQGSVPGTSYSYNSNASTQDDSDDNPSDPGWVSYNGTMTPAVGYAGKGAGTVTFSGTVNNGNVTVPLVYHAFDNTYTQTTPGTPFNLVGNPYPSAISAAQLIANNSNIDGTIYFWDDDLSGGNDYSRTDFAYWNGTGGLGTGAGSVGAPNGSISTAQGFYVRALSGGTLTFNNGQRVAGSNTQFFKPNGADSRLWLSVETDSLFNQILVGVLEDATDEEDRLYDAFKMRSGNGISLSALGNDVEHAIMAFPPPAANKTVPLRVNTTASGTHTFTAQTVENFAEFDIYLDDAHTGNSYQLQEGVGIPITLAAGEYTHRFYLNLVRTSFTGMEEAEESPLTAYVANGHLTVGCNGCAPDATIELLDMSGRVVLSDRDPVFEGGMSVHDITALSIGVYVVRVSTANQVFTQKVIKQ